MRWNLKVAPVMRPYTERPPFTQVHLRASAKPLILRMNSKLHHKHPAVCRQKHSFSESLQVQHETLTRNDNLAGDLTKSKRLTKTLERSGSNSVYALPKTATGEKASQLNLCNCIMITCRSMTGIPSTQCSRQRQKRTPVLEAFQNTTRIPSPALFRAGLVLLLSSQEANSSRAAAAGYS